MEITKFYKKPEEIVTILNNLNPRGEFWVEKEKNWVMTNMPLRKIHLRSGMRIASNNGKNYLKIQLGIGIYQMVDIINPKGRNLYNRY